MLLAKAVGKTRGNKKGRGGVRGLLREFGEGKGQCLSGHGNANARHRRRARQHIDKRVAKIDMVMLVILTAVAGLINR